jgi:hypothetical protein
MTPWSLFLSQLDVGRPCVLRDYGIAIVPILSLDPRPLEAYPLRWGITNGKTRVTEVGDGRVNRVCVTHDGVTPILVLDGEEVLGAKQNRMFNASFLVPPQEATVLPVSCVERERWRADSATFTPSNRTVVNTVRSAKLRRVARSLVIRNEYDADQRAIWNDVDSYIERTNVVSRTASHADAADSRASIINAALDEIEIDPRQVGIAAITSAGHVTMDVFGSLELFARAWRIVARGMLAESSAREPPRRSDVAIRALLASLKDAELREQPAPGLGRSLFAHAADTTAAAIEYGDRVYHLFAASRYAA